MHLTRAGKPQYKYLALTFLFPSCTTQFTIKTLI